LSKTPSFANQLTELFNGNLAIGDSRHDAKTDMREQGRDVRTMGDHIHSWGTFKTELKNAIKVFKDLKAQYGPAIKYIRDATPQQIAKVFDSYRAQGLSPNTIVARQGALRRVETLTGHTLLSATAPAQRQFSPRGVYSDSQVKAITAEVAKVNPQIAQVLKVQAAFGLRLREAIWLRADKVSHTPGGQVSVEVKGKGGRVRSVVALDKTALQGLDLKQHYPLRDGRKEQTQMRAVEQAVRQACRRLGITPRGTHPIRAAAANRLYQSLLDEGLSQRSARQAVALWLGHNRTTVLRHYGL